jgi:hypothetical protein
MKRKDNREQGESVGECKSEGKARRGTQGRK